MVNKTRPILVFMFIPLFTSGLILLILMLHLPSQASSEATFTVNSISDTDDGTCNVAHCTLREAIKAANVAAGPDTIVFSLLPGSTITLAGSQLPAIIDTLTIDGSTAVSLTISGDNLSGIFQIGSGTNVSLSTLTMKEGQSNSGGAIQNDGGILTISDSVFSNNLAVTSGGAIFNSGGTVTIVETKFIGNRAEMTFSFPATSGGAIFNSGTLTIIDSAFSNNGSFAYDDPMYPTFTADSSGGAIENLGVLTVLNSTFNNNLAFAVAPYFTDGSSRYLTPTGSNYSSRGGAIANYGLIIISNSTFSGNRADVAETFINNQLILSIATGGGVNNSSTMTVTNSTFSNNTTTIFPVTGGTSAGSGGGINSSGTMSIINTIIANGDDSGDCLNTGTIPININNLVEDGSCSPFLTGDPLLGPLQDNGGPTRTHALTAPSPAVDSGDEATCAAAPVSNLDQRGVIRPIDGDGDGVPRCDIGAYEYDGPPPSRSFLPILRHD